jgi:hypothetical protein
LPSRRHRGESPPSVEIGSSRLQVSMDDAELVGGLERLRYLIGNRQGFVERKRALFDAAARVGPSTSSRTSA